MRGRWSSALAPKPWSSLFCRSLCVPKDPNTALEWMWEQSDKKSRVIWNWVCPREGFKMKTKTCRTTGYPSKANNWRTASCTCKVIIRQGSEMAPCFSSLILRFNFYARLWGIDSCSSVMALSWSIWWFKPLLDVHLNFLICRLLS